jgi:outer membrane protein assembly factor BamB
MIIKKSLFLLILFSNLIISQTGQLWQTDLGEPIKGYNFINSNKYLFFTSGEYLWCYDATNGNEIWKNEIPDFEEKGVNFLLGEMYLTNSDNKLQAYDAITGKMLWENEYDDIDQEDYKGMEFIKNNAVFDFGDFELGIDLNNGKELYRMEIDYWGKLVELGTFNYSVLEKQNKMLVMEDDEKAVLFDITNGKRLFEKEGYDVNTDLIDEGLPWLYQSPDDEYLLFVLDNGVAVIDVKNNKELFRREFSIDGDLNVLLPTTNGCAVMGEEKFVHFDFSTGEVKEFNFAIDDLRTMHACKIGNKDILLLSMEDRLASLDLAGGKVLWITKEDDPDFVGYAHRYLGTDGNNILLSYVKATSFTEENGTYIYAMSINGITGKVNYKTPVLHSKQALMGFQRVLGSVFATTFSAFAEIASGGNADEAATDMINEMMGYGNIGFDYKSFNYGDDNIVFFTGGTSSNVENWEMRNPETREEPGEGFASVNFKTGKANYKTYFPIAAGLDGREVANLATLKIIDNIAYKAGNERVIKFDLNSGKKLWEVSLTDKVVCETTKIDDVLYLRFGIQRYEVKLKKDEVKMRSTIDESPYGFMAIDDASGKILWEKEIESDPNLLTPKFDIKNYYDDKTKHLYFADLENIYALKMGKNGGEYEWSINFDGAGIGEYDYEESYAVTEKWLGSETRSRSTSTYIGGGWSMVSTTTSGGYNDEALSGYIDDLGSAELSTTYTSWGNIWGVSAKKCLRILYGTDKVILFGPEKIALVNSANGKIVWAKEWDYDNEDIQYVPKVMNGNIIYCMDKELVLIDTDNGKEVFREEIDEKSKFFTSPDEKNIFNLYDEEIAGFSLKTK